MAENIKNFDFILIKLIHKQKLFLYQIARLDYKIWVALLKLESVNKLISTSEANIYSLNNSLAVAGNGEVYNKLKVWKTKEEYNLFKLQLRKNKIDVCKLVINQSKLRQTKEALLIIDKLIADLQKQSTQNQPIIENEPTINVNRVKSIYKDETFEVLKTPKRQIETNRILKNAS